MFIDRTEKLVKPLVLAAALLMLCTPHGSTAAVRRGAHTASAKGPPDWSGLWVGVGGNLFDPTARNRPENKDMPPFEARDFPPYNAEYEARYSKIVADLRKGVPPKDPSAACLPVGLPRMMILGYPLEFVIQPNRVLVLFELESQRRTIYTDGRRHTPPDDFDLTFSGESIGHWEGDTLVVDTTGLRGNIVFDNTTAPHSDALHIVERIRRVDHDIIEDRMVLEDREAFTKPWLVTRSLKLQPGWQMKEYVCENNRSPSGAPVVPGQ
jgi:hypothetical protein